MSIMEKDLGELLFEKMGLFFYERMRRNERRNMEKKKQRFIKQNTIVVTVNQKVIYDSISDGIMTDELFYTLVSYGVVKNTKVGNKKKGKVEYNFSPKITSIIPEGYV